MSFNKIIIVGYLGRDPELKYTPQGTAVCKVAVATSERRKNAQGESEDMTTWFRVTLWGRQTELASEHLSKGRQVYVEGRLRQEEYTDREGNPRTSLEVNASDLQFIGSKGDAPAPATEKPAATKEQAKAALASPAETEISEDEVPFLRSLMKLKEVTVSFGLTVNLGNFQSARLESAATYLAADSESYDDVYQQAFTDTYHHIREQALVLYAKRNKEVLEILAALPDDVQAQIKERG